jgi:methyl-accepting chemotaxis protein/hemerythrin
MDKKFVWTEEYSVQNKLIDEQHQTFFAIANELIDLSENGAAGKGVLLDEVNKLGDYAFSEYNYPDAPEHVEAHNAFRNKVMGLMDAVRGGEDGVRELSKETAEFAGEWLINHILVMDKKYTQFFREEGLS